jgi:uncharacterized repeat protein (TIGR01451 family)
MRRPVVSSVFRFLIGGVCSAITVLVLGSCGGSSSEPSSEPEADLVATLLGPSDVSTTGSATYTVRVRNDGPDQAKDVVASLDLLSGMTPVAGEPVTVANGRATWPAVSTLASGGTTDLTVELSAATPGTGTLTARATSATHDPAAPNNDGSAAGAQIAVTVTPPTSTDLQVSFGGTLAGVSGSAAAATITVQNAGPLTATNLVVELILPDEVTATNLSPAGGVRANGRITWALANLGAGATSTITLDLTVPLLSLTPLTATAHSDTDESLPADNTADSVLRAVVGAVYSVTGEGLGDNFGWEAEDVGDVNGDGKHDFAVTAPYNDAGGNNAGRGYVYSGATGGLLYKVTGDTPNGELGLSVAAVGDIDGDGISEIAFGAPFASTGAGPGYVLVVSGATGATVFRFTTTTATFVGYGVGGAGDLTGDGIPDILVGAPGQSPGGVPGAGTVFIVSGATGTAVGGVDGTVPNGLFGAGVGTVGDLNSDNVPDFVVGSSNESRIRIFSGADGALLFPAIGVANGGTLGQYWIFPTGDMDADGVPDVFSADINNATGGVDRGQAYVFSGATGLLIRTFNGEAANDQFGMGRPIGDVTGDGITDFVLAAWLRSEGATNSGKMYVVDGATGTTLRSLVSTIATETLGFDVISVGDVTGDGLVDYIITGGQAINPGKAYLIAGVPLQ